MKRKNRKLVPVNEKAQRKGKPHASEELGKFRDLIVEAKDKGIEIATAVAKQMLDRNVFIFGAVDFDEASTTEKLHQSTELQNALVRCAYRKYVGPMNENRLSVKKNLCRRYYRCGFAAANMLRNDRHVFKWVDEAYLNEIEQLLHHVSVFEEEVKLLKIGSNVHTDEGYAANETERMQIEVLGSVEEMLRNANRSTRWLIAGFFGACLLMVVLVIILKK